MHENDVCFHVHNRGIKEKRSILFQKAWIRFQNMLLKIFGNIFMEALWPLDFCESS